MQNIQNASVDAMNEAALAVANRIPYLTADEFRYALLRRLVPSDEDLAILQGAIIGTVNAVLDATR